MPTPPSPTRASLEVAADRLSAELSALAARWRAGEVNDSGFRLEFAGHLKAAHLAATLVAVGGRGNFDAQSASFLGNRLKAEYGYLSRFSREAPDLTDAQVSARAALYGRAIVGTFEEGSRRAGGREGFDEERRLLGPTDASCRECRAYAAQGWVAAGTLPGVGQKCTCKSNCLCRFEMRRSGAATMSDEVKPGDDAAFALEHPDADGDVVLYRDSLLFRAGEYADKNFTMTPEELRAAAEAFSAPVPNVIDHVGTLHGVATILDGQLGEVREVRVGGDGSELRGTVAIPKWLDAVWKGPKRVSCEWGHRDKALRRLGLVVRGRVPDAALMAAFSETTPEAAAAVAEFTARKQHPSALSAHQAVHDSVAQAWPGVCSGEKPPADEAEAAAFGDRAKQWKALKSMHDQAAEHGAVCAGKPAAMSAGPIVAPEPAKAPKPKGKFMSWLDAFKTRVAAVADEATPKDIAALFAETAPETPTAARKPAEAPAEPAATFSDSPEWKAAQKKITDLEARLESERVAKIDRDAAVFSQGAVDNGVIPDTLREPVTALLKQLANDDHKAKVVVTFAVGGPVEEPFTGDRVAAFTKILASLPKAQAFMMTEYLDGSGSLKDGYSAVFNQVQAKDPNVVSEERKKQLLALTPTGRATLAH